MSVEFEDTEWLIAEVERLRVTVSITADMRKALDWIHVYLGSECDWDELDDGMEARWYRDVAKLLSAAVS